MKPAQHPTLLRIPSCNCREPASEMVLPRQPDAYEVRQVGAEWRVTIAGTSELIYVGTGPVEIVRSVAPF